MRKLLMSVILVAPAATAAAPKKVTYDDHVLPIFRETCVGCHNLDRARGGLDLSSYAGLMEGGASGDVVAAGDPDGSRLFKLMAHTEKPIMPPNSPKTADAKLKVVREWIAGGLLENAKSKAARAKPKAGMALKAAAVGRPKVAPMPEKPLPLETSVVARRGNAVIAMAANPWSPLLAVGGQKQVLLYNTDTLQLVGILPFEPGVPHVLRFSRNGSLLLAGGGKAAHSGKVIVYDIKTGEPILNIGNEADAVLAADISSDQRLVALGGPGKTVRVYETETGKLKYQLKKHTDWITAIEFSPDAVLLATGDRAGNLFAWEAQTGAEFYTLKGHKGGITGVSWRDDSNAFASASEDRTVKLWEMQNGRNYKSWNAHGDGTLGVHFGHIGKPINIATAGRDGRLKLHDLNGGLKKQMVASKDVVISAALTHDNARAVSGDWLGAVKVWDVQTGKLLGELTTNPPKLTDRLAAAAADLKKAEANLTKATQRVANVEKWIEGLNRNIAADRKKSRGKDKKAAKAARDRLKKSQKSLGDARKQLPAAKKAAAEAEGLLKRAAAHKKALEAATRVARK